MRLDVEGRSASRSAFDEGGRIWVFPETGHSQDSRVSKESGAVHMEENGTRMRWDYTLVLRNRGLTVITLERMELGSRAAGSVDDIWGGMDSRPYTERLDPNRELRLSGSDSWGCPRCGPGELPRFFADGIVRSITFTGRDALGVPVKVDVRIGLNGGVGTRQ
jgi:hypothetical protein